MTHSNLFRLIHKAPDVRELAREAIVRHRARLRVALVAHVTHRLRWLKDPSRPGLELGLCTACGGGATLAGGREVISAALLAPCPLSEPVLIVCPWCDGFDRSDPRHAGISHSMCPSCAASWPGAEATS